MMKFLAALKLVMLCTFLFVQTAQADHFAEHLVDSDHIECLACKSLNDPIADAEPVPSVGKIVASSNKVTRTVLNTPPANAEYSDLARAPCSD